ncbi:MAG: amidohydrolase family protein [Chloroflexota bacterium]|nr:amidohydrolase family protein [Chloroflexota bacterium]
MNALVLEGRLIEDGGSIRVTVRSGLVTELDRIEGSGAAEGGALADGTAQARSAWISAGWMDIQVNGFGGHDPNAADARPETVADMVRALWRHGVTAVCPTIITQSEAHIVQALRTIADACDRDPLLAASVVGIHVEGPHISREDGPRGAHPLAHVRPPDVDEYRRWQEAARGRIRIITLSPEYAEAVAYVRAIVADGVVASVGHTGATGEQIRAAVDAGATWSTHLGNGAHALIPRHPNYIWEQLAEDRLKAGFILDGHHLPPAVIRSVIRAKGVERSILVTDAIGVAGLPPGVYTSAVGGTVELAPSGRLTLQGTPYLAGSATTLPVCVGIAMRHAGVTLRDAIRMVTANPSRLLGLGQGAGHESVRAGMAANLTVFRAGADGAPPLVERTIVAGSHVYGPA